MKRPPKRVYVIFGQLKVGQKSPQPVKLVNRKKSDYLTNLKAFKEGVESGKADLIYHGPSSKKEDLAQYSQSKNFKIRKRR